MRLVKLDTYDYTILPGIIRISLSSSNDPDSLDILSEIQLTDGKIFVEGRYYSYLGKYDLYGNSTDWCMDLQVIEEIDIA